MAIKETLEAKLENIRLRTSKPVNEPADKPKEITIEQVTLATF